MGHRNKQERAQARQEQSAERRQKRHQRLAAQRRRGQRIHSDAEQEVADIIGSIAPSQSTRYPYGYQTPKSSKSRRKSKAYRTAQFESMVTEMFGASRYVTAESMHSGLEDRTDD